jgi:predicted RNase H-like HicB family nuclease
MTAQWVEFTLKLPVKFTKKRKWYVASCPVLNIVSQGETKKKARDNLFEALVLFLETCFDMGTLDDALLECGLRPAKNRIRKPLKSQEYMNVPLNLIATPGNGKSCHQSRTCHA